MRTVKRIVVVVVIAVLGIVLGVSTGCKKGETPEEKEAREMKEAEPKYDNSLEGEEGIKNAIKGYNQALITGNTASRYLKLVRKYATDYETSRVIVFVEEDRSKGRIMRSKLAELVFEKITTLEDKVEVITSERWEFDYIDHKTGEVVEPMREMSYKLKYILVRMENKWMVGKLEQLETPRIKVYSPAKRVE